MRSRACSLLLLPAAVAGLIASPCPCDADGSWQLRSFPSGSAVRIEAVSPSSFYLIGEFDGSREWTSEDGGSSGSYRNPGPPFGADSVASFSAALSRQGAVTLDGRLWLATRDGRDWSPLAVPDSVGTPSAVYCRQGELVWVGTRGGEVLSINPSASPLSWSRSGSLGDAPVGRILPSGDDRLCVLFDDGTLLASPSLPAMRSHTDREDREPRRPVPRAAPPAADSEWTAAPFLVSHFDMTRTGTGYAIERASLVLWKTADGGISWNAISDALADPGLAPWASQARRFLLRDGGFGVIASGDLLLATADEGESWRIAANGVGMFLDAAIDASGDLVTVGARIHRSTDRANSLVQIFGGDFSRVAMGSISTGWAVDRGLLLSVNQGERWLRQPIPGPAGQLTQIAARGDYEILLHFDGSAGPQSYRSGNRGADYDPIDVDGALDGLGGWAFPAPGIGWAWADSSILRSSNGGLDWSLVKSAPEAIAAMGVRDSLDGIFATRSRFLMTRDGGETWEAWESPRAKTVRCLCWGGGDRFIAAGNAIALIQAESGGSEVAESQAGDTIRSLIWSGGGSGWAVGDHGTIAGTTDGGISWPAYRTNLELNAFRGNLSALSMIDPDHAVTGSGTSLIRLYPDANGPIFRYGLAVNPYLPDYLDIHVTARERLQDDRLEITIDGQPVPTDLFDPDGFLYRAHYRLPAGSGQRRMVTRASDWTGNERVDTRFIGVVALDHAGDGLIAWGGEPLAIRGAAMGAVGLLEIAAEAPPFADDEAAWRASGSPFQLAAGRPTSISPLAPGAALASWEPSGTWHVLPASSTRSFADGSILLIVRAAAHASLPDVPLLRILPLPARDACTIVWGGPLAAPFRWELFDLSGRLLAGGMAPQPGARTLRIPTRDAAGRDLPSGVYWIRVEEGPAHAVRRLAIVR